MADTLSSTQSTDLEFPEETMQPPMAGQLRQLRPQILLQPFHNAIKKDKQILEELQRTHQTLAKELQKSIQIQSQAQKIYNQAAFCYEKEGSEDFWTFFVVWPILQLAREVSGLEEEVLAVPLTSINVCPTSLLPKWDGEIVARRIDIGLVIKLEGSIEERIQSSRCDLGPSSTTIMLQDHPLFCHIEVKKQHQAIDPIVQVGVWASAVYARWEQLIQGSKDLPITFGWTIEGHFWQLYMIRQLSNGSRRLTSSIRQYDTRSLDDINLIIASIIHLINHGNDTFRNDFLVNVLGISGGRTTRRRRKGLLLV